MNVYILEQGPIAWVGFCQSCHALHVYGGYVGNLEITYRAKGEAYRAKGEVDVKVTCTIPYRVTGGHGNILEEECGGTVRELPNQAQLISAFLLGGSVALVELATPALLARSRDPQPWW